MVRYSLTTLDLEKGVLKFASVAVDHTAKI